MDVEAQHRVLRIDLTFVVALVCFLHGADLQHPIVAIADTVSPYRREAIIGRVCYHSNRQYMVIGPP